MANNYRLICTDKHSETPKKYTHVYYFETYEAAQHAKKCIEQGGNRAKVSAIK